MRNKEKQPKLRITYDKEAFNRDRGVPIVNNFQHVSILKGEYDRDPTKEESGIRKDGTFVL